MPSIGTEPIARLPDTTSVIVPVTREPVGTASWPFTERLDATVASKGSPAFAVLDDRSELSATVSAVPDGTSTRFSTSFMGAVGDVLEANDVEEVAGAGFFATF